ncbi:RCC1/BLIP-II protein [Trametes coccinea BRFM310]|uniref:RCC1/BLIP-II protein n=1 Tax=Trametes coccinea (strain BRFM310) TaxID=1353009 RepID=A0A1Y2IJ95_TRAC3|nr:RCC1/BLIP-II protein [Trametes coccinea BRFM310]
MQPLAMPSIHLYSAGSNARGQLASGNLDDAHHFMPCLFAGREPGSLPADIAGIDHIACGANHTLALLRKTYGRTELWGCGDGSRGQLGPSYLADVAQAGEDATAVFRRLHLDLPRSGEYGGVISDEYTVHLIAAGWETSYVVLSHPTRDDILLSMGANDFGNLGVGGELKRAYERGAQNQVYVVPLRDCLPAQCATGVLSILTLSSGPHHTITRVQIALPNGPSTTYLLGWGTARHGQLGAVHNASGRASPFISSPHLVSSNAESVTQIAIGNQHTTLLNTSGALIALGSNRKDQLTGLSTLLDVERVGCTWNGTYALLHNGALLATGSNTHSQLGRGTGGRERQGTLAPVRFPFQLRPGQVVQMACGSEHVLCVMNMEMEQGREPRREVWGWGWNEHGNLGTGGTEDVDLPVRMWPPPGEEERGKEGTVLCVWAGCGTSWILLQQ